MSTINIAFDQKFCFASLAHGEFGNALLGLTVVHTRWGEMVYIILTGCTDGGGPRGLHGSVDDISLQSGQGGGGDERRNEGDVGKNWTVPYCQHPNGRMETCQRPSLPIIRAV